jgi:HTH-like domain
VSLAREAHDISERRACSIIGADRSTMRYRQRRGNDMAVRTRLKELAAERRRFGWRRLKLLLAREGIRMNHKKLRRLYAEDGCRCVVASAANEPLARERRCRCRRARISAGRWTSPRTP